MAGMSLRFQVAGYMQLVGGGQNWTARDLGNWFHFPFVLYESRQGSCSVGNSQPVALSDSLAWEVANRQLKVAVWLFFCSLMSSGALCCGGQWYRNCLLKLFPSYMYFNFQQPPNPIFSNKLFIIWTIFPNFYSFETLEKPTKNSQTCTVEPLSTDTSLIWTPLLGTVSNVLTAFSYIFFKRKTSIIRTLSNTDNGHLI